jgi:hypothetical protein
VADLYRQHQLPFQKYISLMQAQLLVLLAVSLLHQV